jgi:hypothetical protein
MDHRLVVLKKLFQLLGVGLRAVPQAKERGIDHGLLLKDCGPQFFHAGLDLLKDIKDCFNVRFHLNVTAEPYDTS